MAKQSTKKKPQVEGDEVDLQDVNSVDQETKNESPEEMEQVPAKSDENFIPAKFHKFAKGKI